MTKKRSSSVEDRSDRRLLKFTFGLALVGAIYGLAFAHGSILAVVTVPFCALVGATAGMWLAFVANMAVAVRNVFLPT